MNILKAIFGGMGSIVAPGFDYLKTRATIKADERRRTQEFKEAVHVRRMTLVEKGLAADVNWEMAFANQAANSWKDEYTLIVCSVPLVMAFIPGLDVYVARGFASFSATPLWYQVMVQTMFYATVGIRMWRNTQYDTP
jgi:hypothetical protein